MITSKVYKCKYSLKGVKLKALLWSWIVSAYVSKSGTLYKVWAENNAGMRQNLKHRNSAQLTPAPLPVGPTPVRAATRKRDTAHSVPQTLQANAGILP